MCAGTLLLAISGCSSRSVVARVNTLTLNEADFHDRAERVTAVPSNSGLDAGGVAILNFVNDSILAQITKDKGYSPTDAQVNTFLRTLKVVNPQLDADIRSGKATDDDYRRQILSTLSLFAIGTEGAKADAAEIQNLYTKEHSGMRIQGSYTLRFLTAQTAASAQKALDVLKSSGDFTKAIEAAQLPAAEVNTSSHDVVIAESQAPPQLKAALDPLKPEQLTPAPVAISGPGSPQAVYIVARLIEHRAARELTVDEVRPILERKVIEQRLPAWKTHADQVVTKYKKEHKDDIQITPDRYKPLMTTIMQPAPEQPAAAPGAPAAAGSAGAVPDVSPPAPSSGQPGQ